MPVLVDYIRDRFQGHLDNVAVVSPDAGRIRVAEQWAQRLGGGPLAFVHKTRDITRRTRRSPTVWSATSPARTACLSMT